jgi:hypothetical protein
VPVSLFPPQVPLCQPQLPPQAPYGVAWNLVRGLSGGWSKTTAWDMVSLIECFINKKAVKLFRKLICFRLQLKESCRGVCSVWPCIKGPSQSLVSQRLLHLGKIYCRSLTFVYKPCTLSAHSHTSPLFCTSRANVLVAFQ